MTTFITTTSIASGARYILLGTGDQIYVLPGVVYGSTDDLVIGDSFNVAFDMVVVNYGTLLSGSSRAVALDNSESSTFENVAGASIRSNSTVTFSADSTFLMVGNNNTVRNAGTISTVQNFSAVSVAGANLNLECQR